jgi:uncharacterized protein YjaG (DUF416 family)
MSNEISHALFVDLTKPEGLREFPATELSKKLIEWVGLDVVRFRRNYQVACRIVDHCRETYDSINDVIDKLYKCEDEKVDFDQFTRYSDAVDALEAWDFDSPLPTILSLDLSRYLFRFLWTSELEAIHYLAKADSIHDCISGAITWVENRKALRNIAFDFTAQDELMVCPTLIPPLARSHSRE